MQPRACFAHATLENVRYAERITDLPGVLLPAILHDASPADDLEIMNFRQLRQQIVLESIRKKRALPVIAEIFKWQHSNSGYWQGLNRLAFPNIPSNSGDEAA